MVTPQSWLGPCLGRREVEIICDIENVCDVENVYIMLFQECTDTLLDLLDQELMMTEDDCTEYRCCDHRDQCNGLRYPVRGRCNSLRYPVWDRVPSGLS